MNDLFRIRFWKLLKKLGVKWLHFQGLWQGACLTSSRNWRCDSSSRRVSKLWGPVTGSFPMLRKREFNNSTCKACTTWPKHQQKNLLKDSRLTPNQQFHCPENATRNRQWLWKKFIFHVPFGHFVGVTIVKCMIRSLMQVEGHWGQKRTLTSSRNWFSCAVWGSRLITGVLRMLRARFAYFSVFNVSSKLVSAVLFIITMTFSISSHSAE